jgi:hypothetical protein
LEAAAVTDVRFDIEMVTVIAGSEYELKELIERLSLPKYHHRKALFAVTRSAPPHPSSIVTSISIPCVQFVPGCHAPSIPHPYLWLHY